MLFGHFLFLYFFPLVFISPRFYLILSCHSSFLILPSSRHILVCPPTLCLPSMWLGEHHSFPCHLVEHILLTVATYPHGHFLSNCPGKEGICRRSSTGLSLPRLEVVSDIQMPLKPLRCGKSVMGSQKPCRISALLRQAPSPLQYLALFFSINFACLYRQFGHSIRPESCSPLFICSPFPHFSMSK